MKKLVERDLENEIEISASGDKIKKLTGLNPEDINNGIDYLDDLDAVNLLKYPGTEIYNFSYAIVTSKGRYLYNELFKSPVQIKGDKWSFSFLKSLPERPYHPVGSPYGFSKENWKSVSSRKKNRGQLYVVFGLQYKSNYYNTNKLIQNIKEYFGIAVENYNSKSLENVELNFEKLAAGLGEHLFNNITEKIIGSDIAVFEVSDLNPNVMIELGVALTWGVRVLIFKEINSPKTPSDISGHTWIEHEDSGKKILHDDFQKKLNEMVERAIMSKRG